MITASAIATIKLAAILIGGAMAIATTVGVVVLIVAAIEAAKEDRKGDQEPPTSSFD